MLYVLTTTGAAADNKYYRPASMSAMLPAQADAIDDEPKYAQVIL